MKYINREEAIEKVGLGPVDFVDNITCEMTGRNLDVESVVEFASSVDLNDPNFRTLTAYYYQDEDKVLKAESLDDLYWETHGYVIRK